MSAGAPHIPYVYLSGLFLREVGEERGGQGKRRVREETKGSEKEEEKGGKDKWREEKGKV